MAEHQADLGFSYRQLKTGDFELAHHGHKAATLRARSAEDFLAEIQDLSFAQAQQLMARVTGNYKRGNERRAAGHPRNLR